jgi:hypothetical protein
MTYIDYRQGSGRPFEPDQEPGSELQILIFCNTSTACLERSRDIPPPSREGLDMGALRRDRPSRQCDSWD